MSSQQRISGSELRRSLNINILAITFGMVFFTVFGAPVGSPLFTGFMRSLGAGDLVYGIVMALPVLGALAQILGSYFLESTGKRKLLFLAAGFVHRFLWIPVALIPLLVPAVHQSVRIWSITLLITISAIANSVATTAFWSWMGALVPMEIKGRFFSNRTMISTIAAAVTAPIVSYVVDRVHGFNGFAVIFTVAALFGAADIFCFIFIKNPVMELPKEKTPLLKLFFEPFTNRNYMRYITFVTVWCFGVNFAAPFFNVYMIEHLKMSYLTLALFAQVGGNITTILFIRRWGRLADLYGNKPVIKLCCSVICILPILWLFATTENIWIVLLINILAGLCWPGYEMAALNQSVWLAPEKNRSIYVAVYSLVTSVFGVAFAYICGGAFMQYSRSFFHNLSLPFFLGQTLSSYHVLFLISSFVRLLALTVFLPRVREEHASSALQVMNNICGFFTKKFNAKNGATKKGGSRMTPF
ncbi:MAG: MFS transporter [Clostridia bacterium]|nr:MFS transporter [Clostridia bacterium]